MAAYQHGEHDAATALIERLSPQLHRFFMAQSVSRRYADDLLQDTWLRIHEARHTYRPGEPVLPWIYAIARYKLIDALRRLGTPRDIPIEALADTAAEADELSPSVRDVERGLSHLPKVQRQVVRTIAMEGASIGEAAARLRMTPGAVRVAFHRGLRALAKGFG